jgi:hypothetical protein
MRKATMIMFATLRQLRYPKEFRIKPPVWPPDLLSAFEKLAQVLERHETVAQYQEKQETEEERMRFLADIGTGLWRLRQKMVKRCAAPLGIWNPPGTHSHKEASKFKTIRTNALTLGCLSRLLHSNLCQDLNVRK